MILRFWRLFFSLKKKVYGNISLKEIERKNRIQAIQSIKEAENIIKNLGYHVVIFPEGTRTIDGKLQKFKKGGFHMAINTNTSILLIVHKNTYLYKPKNRWTLSPRVIEVVIGPVIDISGYDRNNIDELIFSNLE